MELHQRFWGISYLCVRNPRISTQNSKGNKNYMQKKKKMHPQSKNLLSCPWRKCIVSNNSPIWLRMKTFRSCPPLSTNKLCLESALGSKWPPMASIFTILLNFEAIFLVWYSFRANKSPLWVKTTIAPSLELKCWIRDPFFKKQGHLCEKVCYFAWYIVLMN